MADREPNLHVLIMAGGSGTRFWPKSRAQKPKQLLCLWDNKTLLEHTVARFADRIPQERIWIVTTEKLVGPSREVLGAQYENLHYLGEPIARNTAPCILWGVREIHKSDPSAVIAVMPADHYIGDKKAFDSALNAAVEYASHQGGLVTLGVKPNRPETGFGYIEIERQLAGVDRSSMIERQSADVDRSLPVRQFVEKPDLRTAVKYIESGRYLWNAGMFIFRADAGLEAFAKTMPSLTEAFNRPDSIVNIYKSIRSEDAVSVDYGVMEAASAKGISVAVVPVDCGWNDVGSFSALEEIGCTAHGNVVTHDSASNVVQTDAGLIALLGVNDLVVVRDGDVVLVAAKDRAQDVKVLLEKVRAQHPRLI